MKRYHHLIEGVLQPDEIANLQKIFDAVIGQPWFHLTEMNREAFAAELIRLYRKGVTDFDKLHDLASLTAAAHFSRDQPQEKRLSIRRLHDAQKYYGGGDTRQAPNLPPGRASKQ